MVGSVEIHFHLLPGVDDGPSSIEETVALAAAAAAEGTGTIVATPHVHPQIPTDVSTIAERVREVSARLRRERVRIDVRAGAELGHRMVDRLSQMELDAIAQGPPGRRWLLVEAPLSGFDDNFTPATDQLRARGFAVVLAHPERAHPSSERDWLMIEHELCAGSALQVNAWSVAGLYGDSVRATALRLLRATPRAAIASDAHGGARMPALRLAVDALAGAGDHDPGRFVRAVPRALLEQGLAVGPAAVAA